MAIKFYLEISGKRYMLPVNPSSINVEVPSRNESNGN
nr:MAG TPA: Pvc1, Pvc9, Pvc11, Pvc12, Pvc4, Photorhabdus asymbiotica, PVC, contractile.5A [Caudoviricetes sp.]